jgi:hypothetical protein
MFWLSDPEKKLYNEAHIKAKSSEPEMFLNTFWAIILYLNSSDYFSISIGFQGDSMFFQSEFLNPLHLF